MPKVAANYESMLKGLVKKYNHFYVMCATRSSENPSVSEMFIIEKKGWFGKGSFERSKILAHYTTKENIGIDFIEGKNIESKTSKYLLVYSSNKNEISKIIINLKDSKTGEEQIVDSLSITFKEPFASFVELDTADMEIQSMICYDYNSKIVYEYKS